MPPSSSHPKLPSVVETLALGIGGGALFVWANLPGGLISGAMIAVAIAALAGRPVGLPPALTQTILVMLGISLGSVASKELLQHMSAYPVTVSLLALATFCATFGSGVSLERVPG